MSPDDPAPGSHKDWLRHAYSDLEIACIEPSRRMLLEGLCFHAQQAAEKSLKALLVWRAIPFPKTHSIRMLLDLIPQDLSVPEAVQDAASLTEYAVTSRYPGEIEPVDDDEYRESIRLAEEVVSWVERTIGLQ
ncbi:HEPN domain-containing protein [Dehalococcoidia bacterium]|nr:HEPN domain-containing protein [Dehalococcoidia bacterium]